MLLLSLFTFHVTDDPSTILKLNAGILCPFQAFQFASLGRPDPEVFTYGPSDQSQVFGVFGTPGRKEERSPAVQCHLLSRNPEIVIWQSDLRSVVHVYSA